VRLWPAGGCSSLLGTSRTPGWGALPRRDIAAGIHAALLVDALGAVAARLMRRQVSDQCRLAPPDYCWLVRTTSPLFGSWFTLFVSLGAAVGLGYTARVAMKRKPNVEERRRVLCDARLRSLLWRAPGTHTPQGGTTGGASRRHYVVVLSDPLCVIAGNSRAVAELDAAEFEAVTRQLPQSETATTTLALLAQIVMRSASGVGLDRSRARYELAFHSRRDACYDVPSRTTLRVRCIERTGCCAGAVRRPG